MYYVVVVVVYVVNVRSLLYSFRLTGTPHRRRYEAGRMSPLCLAVCSTICRTYPRNILTSHHIIIAHQIVRLYVESWWICFSTASHKQGKCNEMFYVREQWLKKSYKKFQHN